MGSTTFPNSSTYFSMSNAVNHMAQRSHIDDSARFIPGPVKQSARIKGVSVSSRLGMQREYAGKGIHYTRPVPLPFFILPSISGSRSTGHKATRGEDNTEKMSLTDSPPIPKDRRTRFRLRVIPQEPSRIEFHGIDVSGRVVQNLPVHRIGSSGGNKRMGKEL